MDMQAAIRAVTEQRDLDTADMEAVMRLIMTGQATPAQIGGFLIGNTAEAVIHADAATEREPGLELGWLSALNARNAVADFAGSVQALTELESRFGYDLGPETLKKSKNFSGLLASPEYQAWLAER